MSLLGNRGRFSSPNEKLNIVSDTTLKSELASIGKNPKSLFKTNESPKDKSLDVKERLEANAINKKKELHSEHQKYNNNIFEKEYNEESYINKKRSADKSGTPKKKRVGIKTFIAMFIVELLTIIGILNLAPYLRLAKMTQDVQFDPGIVVPEYIDEETINIMKGYKTVAIFGVDSRNGSVAKGANADVNLILNLNIETGEVELVSLYRDLYLSVTDNNTYDKLNSAYRRGGPEGAVKAINKNFDLNIVNFFSFNWKAVADGISLLGGVDLEISKAEYKYMNAFIHETCIATGVDAKNPAAHYIKSTGMQHLDGIQAVAYGRLRLMDSDFQRVDRQKKIISLCLQKAKSMDLIKLRSIIEAILPQIAYEFDFNEMVSLLRIVNNVSIKESTACPDLSNLALMDMGPCGSCVVPLSLEKAASNLHKILFNEDDYKVSDAVRRYSNRIIEMRHKYQEENSLKQALEINNANEEKNISTVSSINTNVNRKIGRSSPSNAVPISSASVVPIVSDDRKETNSRDNPDDANLDNDIQVEIGVSPSDNEETSSSNRSSTSNGPQPISEPSGPSGPSDPSGISGTSVPNGPSGPSGSNSSNSSNNDVAIGVRPGENIPTNSSETSNSVSEITNGGPTGQSSSETTVVEPNIVIP